jgi:LuxR family transcriptional regulator, maltose regulon positive regulatory protein
MTFARTKIQPPRARSAHVERTLVQTQLANALLNRRVVLLCAPAGYGKTTALAHEIARLAPEHAVAWISADAGDDLQRLLECMLAALEPFDPPWRTAPESLVTRVGLASAEEQRTLAAEIINTLDACEVAHGIIAFEDVHRVDDPAFFSFLDLLIERLSPRWSIAITSRTDPPLALARLRARDELAEFRQLQLQFARDDARRLAAESGLDQAIADRLFDRTQGWPAGMRIAIGVVTGAAGAGRSSVPISHEHVLRAADRPMFDFLVTEVIDKLQPELSDFLLRVSVLPELEAARCAQLADNSNAERLLDEIERLGLFVDVLDAPVPTLRLHDLFREALQQRLHQRDPQLLADLRRRTADTEPDPIRRITLLLDAGELEAAARLVLEHVPRTLSMTGTSTASHLISRFPPAFAQSSPELLFVAGNAAWIVWDFPNMLASFERAEAAFARRGDHQSELWARVHRAVGLVAMGQIDESAALVASMRELELPTPTRIMVLHTEAWLAIDNGRFYSVAPLLERMLDLLEQIDRWEVWYSTTPANRMPGLPGMKQPLLRHARLLLRLAGDEPTAMRALALLLQAWDAFWCGRFEDSRMLAERAREDSEWCGRTGAVHGHFLALTALREAALGNTAVAMDAAETRARDLGRGYSAWGRWLFVLFICRTASTCNDAAILRDALRRADTQLLLVAPTANDARMCPIIALKAQLAWLEGRPAEAVSGWRAALEHEEEIEVWGLAPETRVRLARALLRQGKISDAAAVLLPVFTRAQNDGGPGGALLATDALSELAAAQWDRALGAREQSELHRWWQMLADGRADADTASNAQSRGAAAGTSSTGARPDAGLSARELEVLARIAAGDSNKLIARAFDLSLHTVKRHVAHILDKLDLESRGQAAAWYRSHFAAGSHTATR